MKITVYYEDKNSKTTIEVPDEDCEIWVENSGLPAIGKQLRFGRVV